ncbi:MAG: DNA-processing protein DprA [Gammaproteobacteria bacterium]|nr:DNA-processing protein DprA [Gammaproteobacteria bacterium]
MDDLSYWLALQKASGIASGTLNQLFEHFPKPSDLFNTPQALKSLDLTPARRTHLEKALNAPDWKMVEQQLQWAEADENHILLLTQDNYPNLLKEIYSPPPILYVKGHVEVLNNIQLAMVGSRNPSIDGHETAWQFAHHLAQNGMVITSGMALGIDAQSHYGALKAGGKSIAVAGTGLDRIYPARHKELAWQLIEHGAIVSEYPPGSGPMKYHFPQRNRIISGLSVGTLVVEAALKSGSLITAQTALEQAREVFAIPGSIHNPLSRGCHQLIKNGAKLVETAEDILEELSHLALASLIKSNSTTDTQSTTNPSSTIAENTPKNYSLLPKVQQQILKQVGFTPISIDTIITRTKLSASDVNANLVVLEVEDFIQTHPGGLISNKLT